MYKKKVFVTVGTTKFPKLINTLTTPEIIEAFISLGYDFVQIQTGRDFSSVKIHPDIPLSYTINREGNSTIVIFENKITLKYEEYFQEFQQQIQNSNLVISHAGAGSCLDVLHNKKPLIVVINDDLMDNHQAELAEELEKSGYVYYCNCDSLKDALKKDLSLLKYYPEPSKTAFADYLDKCVGFS